MKRFFFNSILCLSLLLSGCSWTEYFMVTNTSEFPVILRYQISEPQQGHFPIFYAQPLFYELNKNENIDWNKKTIIADTDSSIQNISIVLPANTAILFGSLNNDHYTSKDQTFINGRSFNFSVMEIEKQQELIRITANNFDDFFVKESGMISYNID